MIREDLEIITTTEGGAEATKEGDQSQDQSLDQKLVGSMETRLTGNVTAHSASKTKAKPLPPQTLP